MLRAFSRPFVYLGIWLAYLAGTLALGAVDFAALQPTGYVNDFAGVVDAASKAELERYCARVEASTGAQIALVTLPTLDGQPVEDVANLLYRKWGIGDKKNSEGILVLLSVRDRRSRVEVGYGLEPIIPDGFAGSILREMRPALRENQFGPALMEAANTIGATIAKAKNVEIGDQLNRRRVRQTKDEIPWPILMFLGFLLLMFLMGRGRGGGGRMSGGGRGGSATDLLTGVLLGNVLSGGYRGGRGGGGFGGYDSGGGFGGFGGGDSGGGGASSDW